MSELKEGARLCSVITVSNYDEHKSNLLEIFLSLRGYNLEVVVIGDCLATHSLQEIEDALNYFELTGQVIYSSANNPGGSRNLGIRMSRSAWLTFWDCDDLPVVPAYLSLLEKTIKEGSTIGIGAFEIEEIDSGRLTASEILQDLDFEGIGLNPGIWRMVFNRHILDEVSFPDLSMGEDQVFLQRVLNKNPRITFDVSTVYRYRRGISTQLTRKIDKKRDLLKANAIALREYDGKSQNRKITKTMLIRQGITILRIRKVSHREMFTTITNLISHSITDPGILWKVFQARNKFPK